MIFIIDHAALHKSEAPETITHISVFNIYNSSDQFFTFGIKCRSVWSTKKDRRPSGRRSLKCHPAEISLCWLRLRRKHQ